jgi:hypothetical protein
MLCLDVRSKGDAICTAGLPDGIVSASLGSGTHVGMPPKPGFELTVNGVEGDALVEWATKALYLGDSVTIAVVEAQPDPPTRRYSNPEVDNLAEVRGLAAARAMYHALKRRLSELEAEYGDRLMGERDA